MTYLNSIKRIEIERNIIRNTEFYDDSVSSLMKMSMVNDGKFDYFNNLSLQIIWIAINASYCCRVFISRFDCNTCKLLNSNILNDSASNNNLKS